MKYINFVCQDDNTERMYSAPVAEDDKAYFEKVLIHLKPLSKDQYQNGFGCIINTLARTSYIIDGSDLYWCSEWEPGFIVVKLSENGNMAWTAIRSPIPNFGDRPCTEEELYAYYEDGEDEENHQYNLIFTPWDAQFDEQHREWYGFEPADQETQDIFLKATKKANELHTVEQQSDEWFEQCKTNIAKWCGEGIRL